MAIHEAIVPETGFDYGVQQHWNNNFLWSKYPATARQL
jgi:hypothetical protein